MLNLNLISISNFCCNLWVNGERTESLISKTDSFKISIHPFSWPTCSCFQGHRVKWSLSPLSRGEGRVTPRTTWTQSAINSDSNTSRQLGAFSIDITCMFLTRRKEPENPQWTHTHTHRENTHTTQRKACMKCQIICSNEGTAHMNKHSLPKANFHLTSTINIQHAAH